MGGGWKVVWILLLVPGMMVTMASAGKCFNMFPKNDIFLLVGSDLHVNCTLDVSSTNSDCTDILSDFDVHNISITKGSKELPADLYRYHEAEKTLTMILPNVTFKDTGDYFCKYSNKTLNQALKSVHVGEPPGAPENITCISKSYEDLTCSFSLSKKPVNIPINWTMEFKFTPIDHYKVNCTKTADASYSCQPRNFEIEAYDIHIEGVNIDFGIDVKKSARFAFDKSIVQPNPVYELGYKFTNISSIVELNWTGPIGIYYNGRLEFPLDYKIVILSEWDNRIEWNETGEDNLNSKREYNITDLIPFTDYTVTVQAKPTAADGNIYWSNASKVNFTTKNEVPEHSVILTAGSFVLLDCGKLMCPIIYWKNPARKYWNSPVKGYKVIIWKVVMSEESTIHVDKRNIEDEPEYTRVSTPWSEDILGLRMSGALKTDMLKKESYEVQVIFVNDEGDSLNRSMLLIPDWYTALRIKPKWVSVEMWESRPYISWYVNASYCKAVTSVTYYWCVEDAESPLNSSYVNCKEGFDWYTVNITDGCGNGTGYYIARENNQSNMKYAVSLETMQSSSGMKWENFRFSKKAVPDKPLYTASVDGTTLKVKIQYGDYYVSGGGRPLQFTVVYECVESSDCVADRSVKTFPAKFADPLYIVTSDLNPGSKYSVYVTSSNSLGSSEYGEPQTVSLPEDNPSAIGTILGVVVGVICALVVIALVIYFCRRKCTGYKKGIKITIPDHLYVTVPEEKSSAERDLEKAKSADDHDSGKGSDSLGSSLGQLNLQRDNDGIVTNSSEQSSAAVTDSSVNGCYSSITESQSSPSLPGYRKAGNRGSDNFWCKEESFEDDDLCFEENSAPGGELNNVKFSATHLDPPDTVKDLKKNIAEKSSEPMQTFVDSKQMIEGELVPKDSADYSIAAMNLEGRNEDVSIVMVNEEHEDVTVLKQRLKKQELDQNLQNSVLDKQDVSNNLPNIMKASASNSHESVATDVFKDADFNAEIRALTAQSCAIMTDSDSNLENSGTDMDTVDNDVIENGTGGSSASSKDVVLEFGNFFKDSEISPYRNPDELSLGGETISDSSEDEESIGSSKSELSRNTEVSLTNLSPSESSQVLRQDLVSKTIKDTEKCDLPTKSDVRRNVVDNLNVLSSCDMKNKNDSREDEILSDESKSASLGSYTRTGLVSVPSELSDCYKKDSGGSSEHLEKDTQAQFALSKVGGTVYESSKVGKDKTQMTKL